MSEKKTPPRIYELSVEQLMKQKKDDNFKGFIDKMEEKGFPITYEAAFVSNSVELTAKNILLSAMYIKPKENERIFKSSEMPKIVETMKLLARIPANKESSGAHTLKDIARNMNDNLGSDSKMKDISSRRKFELILFILEAQKQLGSYVAFLEKRKSKESMEREIKENVTRDDDEVQFNDEVQITKIDNDDDEVQFNDDIRKCNENSYDCKDDEECNLDEERCVKSSKAPLLANKIKIGNKTFFGSEKVLNKIRECSIDKQCADGNKYCDLDEYKCIDNSERKGDYSHFFVELDGKKFYGSDDALRKLKNYCYFDKPCEDGKTCLFDKKTCVDGNEKGIGNTRYAGKENYFIFEDKELATQYKHYKKDFTERKDKKGIEKPQETKAQISDVMKEKFIIPKPKELLPKIQETPVPQVFASQAIMQTKPLTVMRKSKEEIDKLIQGMISGKTEQIDNLADVQKKVLQCLGLT